MVAGFDVFTAEEGAAKSVALPGSREAIASLHRAGFRMGVATNDSTRGAEKTLLALGIAQMFDAAYGYDAVANPKPAPDIVQAFCDLTGSEAFGGRDGRRQPPRSRDGARRRRWSRHRRACPAPARGNRCCRWPMWC